MKNKDGINLTNVEIRILNYLNDKYNPTSTIIKDIINLELLDNDYFRVECNIIEIFKIGVVEDISIYFIDNKEITRREIK